MEKEMILKEGRESSLLRGHPWVFSGAIKSLKGQPAEGDWVKALSSSGKYLCAGHYGEQSIALRIVSRNESSAEGAEVGEKIKAAFNLRKKLGLIENSETNCFRLVNAEGDGLPGLVIDLYANAAVVQAHSIGMLRLAETIKQTLTELFSLEVIYLRDSTGSKPLQSLFLMGDAGEVKILENKMQFFVDLLQGQKTGFFIDQRDNRKIVAEYSKDRKVLNCFSYSGGFSIAALKGGAASVVSADLSAGALELLEKNVSLNSFTNSSSIKADCFKLIEEIKDSFDLIILDPPSLAKHKGASRQAIKAYTASNMAAISKIEKGGLIFTFSCSQFVTRQEFESAIMDASIKSGRNVRVLKNLSSAPCHARSIFHPEGEYLKGLMLEVE